METSKKRVPNTPVQPSSAADLQTCRVSLREQEMLNRYRAATAATQATVRQLLEPPRRPNPVSD
jgi:hypothetical protein